MGQGSRYEVIISSTLEDAGKLDCSISNQNYNFKRFCSAPSTFPVLVSSRLFLAFVPCSPINLPGLGLCGPAITEYGLGTLSTLCALPSPTLGSLEGAIGFE